MQDIVPLLKLGLTDLLSQYEGFFIDLWGVVLQDGGALFPGVLPCLQAMREQKKTVIFLSNTSYRAGSVARQLARLGCPNSLYGGVVTSGEDVYHQLHTRESDFYRNLGQNLYHLGPAVRESVFQGTGFVSVATVPEASFILSTGPVEDGGALGDCRDILTQGLDLNLPMICANPDRFMPRPGGRAFVSAGALAEFYEQNGGVVHYHGKPYPSIYGAALLQMQRLNPACMRRHILAIGDSVPTDVRGARCFGVDVAFVSPGVFAGEWGGTCGQSHPMAHPAKRPSGAFSEIPKRWEWVPHFVIPGLVL